MKQTRVTAEELLCLADQIMKLGARASGLSQGGVTSGMNSALAATLEAAKSAAFNEALDRHNTPSPGQSEGEKP